MIRDHENYSGVLHDNDMSAAAPFVTMLGGVGESSEGKKRSGNRSKSPYAIRPQKARQHLRLKRKQYVCLPNTNSMFVHPKQSSK